jgi:preflagellin peptidase FlaK
VIVNIDFELLRILLSAGMLSAASFLDIRKREVSDLLWIAFGLVSLLVYLLEFAYGITPDLLAIVVPISIATAISFGVYKSGLFGGADALALVMLAVIFPTFDGGFMNQFLPVGSEFLLHTLAPLIVLSNAVILSLSQIGFNIASNARYAWKNPGKLFEGLEHESTSRKIIATMIGYRTSSSPSYAFPIEQLVHGRRQFTFAPGSAETAEYESRKNVWVTPGTPFLVFMLAGFVAMLVVGDMSALIFSSLGSFFG